MKIALVHELLTMRGGAERVFKVLADMYPEAPIYTLLYDEKKLGDWFPRERVIIAKPPTLHKLLPGNLKNNHHLYLKHFPRMVESWDFSEFDTVISSSSAFTHGIITNGKPKHISYINAPARYLWDRTHDVIEQASGGILGPIKKYYLHSTFHKLRVWDAEVAARPDTLLAASKEVQKRIELYWRRKSQVVYPPIDNFWSSKTFGGTTKENPDYFLVVSSLVRYKRIELAIEACNNLGLHLKIVGEGSDRKRLEKIAGSTIEFYGYRSHDELGDLYADATAIIFPGEEDFGLVPLEAHACGTPVIAQRIGGALETIVEGKTGEYFDDATADSLQVVLQKFDQKKYTKETCKQRATEFSEEKFINAISTTLSQL
jgi:glycosyltransferase involved in cell wall biosynthesis